MCRLAYLCRYIRTSKAYCLSLALQMALSLLLLLYTLCTPIKDYDEQTVFHVELMLTLMYLADILLQLHAEHKNYFRSWLNILDVIIFSTTFLSSLYFFQHTVNLTKLDQDEDNAIIVLVVTIRLVIRAIIIGVRQRRQNDMSSLPDIQLARYSLDVAPQDLSMHEYTP